MRIEFSNENEDIPFDIELERMPDGQTRIEATSGEYEAAYGYLNTEQVRELIAALKHMIGEA